MNVRTDRQIDRQTDHMYTTFMWGLLRLAPTMLMSAYFIELGNSKFIQLNFGYNIWVRQLPRLPQWYIVTPSG